MSTESQMRPAPASPPETAAVSAHYDEWNAAHRSGGFEEIEPEIRARAERVLARLATAGLERPSILEVGCGTGWMSSRLAEFGPVTGIDLSPAAIEIARGRDLRATFLAADFLEADLPLAAFDVVVCVETLFYVADQRRCVEKMAALARPGSWLGLTCVNKFVYERSSDVGAPPAAQLRRWRSVHETRQLLAPWFEIERVETVAPRGDQGILRFVNSHKVNSMASRILNPERVTRMKERLGLGGGVVFTGRRR